MTIEDRVYQGPAPSRINDPVALRPGSPRADGIAPAADIIDSPLFLPYQWPDATFTTPADSNYGGATAGTIPIGLFNSGHNVYGIPRAFPCLPYDDAGVTFPAGHVRAVVGSPMRWLYSLLSIQTDRHFVDLRIHYSGLPAATTGVILFKHSADWQGGGGTVTEFTVNIDGALGKAKSVLVTELFSVPASVIRQPGSSKFSMFCTVTWTGAAPTYIVVTVNPVGVTDACVVPVALPGGYTARGDTDATRTPRPIGLPDNQITGASPLRDAFRTYRGPVFGFSDWPNEHQLGAPALINLDTEIGTVGGASAPRAGHKPRILIADEFYQMDWFPQSQGTRTFAATHTWGVSGAPYDSGWMAFSAGAVHPGFRNARISGTLFGASILTAQVSVRMGGVTVIGPVSIVTLLTNLDFVDLPDIYPATNDQASTVEWRVEATGFFNAQIRIDLSPRIDVPFPSTITGQNDIYAEGGYDASQVSIPTAYPIVHCGPGVTSDPGGVDTYRWVTFVPPTKGLWRIHVTGFPTSSRTQGMCPARGRAALTVDSALCFAGARLWSTDQITSGTTLLQVIPVWKAMPAGGITMSGANLSPAFAGQFYGEIAVPAAGTYRVWLNCALRRPNAELWVSLTDPYCMDDVRSWRGGDIGHRLLLPTLTTATTPPGAPSHGAGYLIGDGATGIWSGHVGMVAIYSTYLGSYRYLDPARGDVLDATLDGVISVYNDGAWEAGASNRMASVKFTVPAAQTVYVRGCQPEQRGLGNETIPPAIAVYWEAL